MALCTPLPACSNSEWDCSAPDLQGPGGCLPCGSTVRAPPAKTGQGAIRQHRLWATRQSHTPDFVPACTSNKTCTSMTVTTLNPSYGTRRHTWQGHVAGEQEGVAHALLLELVRVVPAVAAAAPCAVAFGVLVHPPRQCACGRTEQQLCSVCVRGDAGPPTLLGVQQLHRVAQPAPPVDPPPQHTSISPQPDNRQ